MKGKIFKLSALITLLTVSMNTSAESYNNITLKLGSYTLGSSKQTIVSPVTFDTKSTSVFAIEYERKFKNNLSWGGELIRYKNTFTPGSNAATGMHVFANVKKYFDLATHVQPFIGAGAGASTVRLSGSSSSGVAGGFGVQFNAGVKFPFEDVSFLVEYKVISSEPSDSAGSSVDLSGNGLFAGLAINF